MYLLLNNLINVKTNVKHQNGGVQKVQNQDRQNNNTIT